MQTAITTSASEDQPPFGIDLEKRWIRRRRRQPERNEDDVLRHAGAIGPQPEEIDPLALRPGIGADVDEGRVRTLLR